MRLWDFLCSDFSSVVYTLLPNCLEELSIAAMRIRQNAYTELFFFLHISS